MPWYCTWDVIWHTYHSRHQGKPQRQPGQVNDKEYKYECTTIGEISALVRRMDSGDEIHIVRTDPPRGAHRIDYQKHRNTDHIPSDYRRPVEIGEDLGARNDDR